MKSFSNSSLTISVKKSGTKVVMEWEGKSADRAPATELTPYLTGITNQLAGCDLTVSFKKLEYMNSSTVQPIVQFMKALDQKGISTEITYNTSLSWQRASFKALETLAMMMKNIRVEGH